jgi:hypothetical protein
MTLATTVAFTVDLQVVVGPHVLPRMQARVVVMNVSADS